MSMTLRAPSSGHGIVSTRMASGTTNLRPRSFSSTQSSVINIGTYALVQKVLELQGVHDIDSTFVSESLGFINTIDALRNKFELVNYPPSISYNDFNELVYEWWGRNKKLTIYHAANSFSFVKAWGTNIHTDMQDGVIESQAYLKDLLIWMEC